MTDTVVEPYRDKRGAVMFPEDILALLPALGTQQKLGLDATVYLHLESHNRWDWFITEWDGKDKFYGYVAGYEFAPAYFTREYLMTLVDKRWGDGPAVMIAPHFTPKPVRDCQIEVWRSHPWKYAQQLKEMENSND